MTVEQQNSLRIAISGHRYIDHLPDVTDSIQAVFAQILEDHPNGDYYLLSALAEGSDQLVAQVAQGFREIKLVVPLPLPESAYLRDFSSNEGRMEFTRLLSAADEVLTISDGIEHDRSYDLLANYLSDQCEVLIALWNGDYAGEDGGTGDVVRRVLDLGKPVYWIYLENLRTGAVNRLKGVKPVGEIQVLNHPSVE